MIEIKNLNITRGDYVLFRNLNLNIGDGEIVGIIGPSGSGKSTLLKCINALSVFDSGDILVKGIPVTKQSLLEGELKTKIGMVFQNFNLFKHLSVIENVMAGPIDVLNVDKKTAYNTANELLSFVNLSDKAYSLPKDLSGGQQQRVAIARTLALNPEVILMDEPTSALDPLSKGEVETIIRLMAQKKRTMLIVSHELELLKSVCTRIIFLNDKCVYEDGTPSEVLDNPKKDQTRRFIRALKVLEMDVSSTDFDFIGFQTTLNEYAFRTGIPQRLLLKMQSVLEELFHVIIIDNKENNQMHFTLEYDYKNKTVSGVVLSTGSEIDTDNPYYFMEWTIINKRCKTLTVEKTQREKYTNLIKFELEE